MFYLYAIAECTAVDNRCILMKRLMTFSVKYSQFLLAVVFALVSIMDMSAQDGSAVNTPATAYTVEEARTMIDNGLAGKCVYVKGVVSELRSSSVSTVEPNKGCITYDISDDGKRKSPQLRLINNYKGADKEEWTDLSEIGTKDEVIVYGVLGTIIKSNNVYPLENFSYLVEHIKFSPVLMDCETVDFTDVYYGKGEMAVVPYHGMSFDVDFAKGTSTKGVPTYENDVDNIHLYKGNTVTIKSTTSNLISRVEVAYTNNTYRDGKPAVSSGTTSYNADNVLIWQLGEPLSEATLTAGETSKFTSITVYYDIDHNDNLYTRDVTPGRVGTICLPYAVEEGGLSGARFYETDYIKEEKLYFSEVKRLEAGMPYIFFADADASKIVVAYSGDEVDEPKSKNGLYGTFMYMSISEADNIVVLSNNSLVLCGDGSSLSANRAYLKIGEISRTPIHADNAKRVSFNLNGEATGIDAVDAMANTSSAVYNLAGQRVVPSSYKGLQIRNGRKYMGRSVSR